MRSTRIRGSFGAHFISKLLEKAAEMGCENQISQIRHIFEQRDLKSMETQNNH
jgi:hypothetical protein